MTLVTRDATSGKWVPQSAAEFTSLFAGRLSTVANPAFLWLCQEAGGNLADSIGACTLTAANTPNYQTPVTGWSRKAVSWVDGSTSRFDNTTTPPDGGTSSLAFFGFFYVNGTPGGNRFMASMTNTAIHIATNGTGVQQYYDNTIGTGATVINDGAVRPFLPIYNRAAATSKMYTPTEIVDGGYVSSTGVRTVIGAFPALNTPLGGCLFACQWTGAGAEMSATDAATVLDAFTNGPAVASIAVTPTSYTLGTIGATQQMGATATRADGSTYDCTATATWLSSDPTKATVSATGLVTAVAAGTANITASFTSLNAATATSPAQTVTVTGGGVTLTSITVVQPDSIGDAGGTRQLTAIGTYSDTHTADITSTVTWSSATPSVATVSGTGLLRGVVAGSSVITATVGAVSGTVTATVVASAKYARMMTALLPPGKLWH